MVTSLMLLLPDADWKEESRRLLHKLVDDMVDHTPTLREFPSLHVCYHPHSMAHKGRAQRALKNTIVKHNWDLQHKYGVRTL
jgi:hypothetical protein